jgi:ribonuclease/clavin/mitogillin
VSTKNGENLYELVLNNLSARGEKAEPPLPPVRPSAAVIPWRRTNTGDIEVYWIRRSDELPFMGGWHAFPGGGVSRSDAALPVAGTPQGAGEGPPAAGFPESLGGVTEDPGPDLVPGLVAGALRELFEEVGILPATPAADPDEVAELRRAVLAKEKSFADVVSILADQGCTLDASRLVWAGRWMTPPFAPFRFDNRFFLLEWPREEPVQPTFDPGECAEGGWIAPGEALEMVRRGEGLTAPPILHILEVLHQEGIEAGLGRLRDPSETNIGPLRRIEMRPGVLLFPMATHTLPPASTTNAYLLGTGEAVLIDPGSPLDAENERLERALAVARERLGRRVVAIWLTHHHPDHIGGVERLRKTLNVPVLAHPATAERLAGRIAIDGELTDGQRIELRGPDGEPPFAVSVVHTPGHARGHLCFVEETWRSAIVGDLIAGLGTIVIDPPEGDMQDYLGSLGKLAALRPSTLFPAHGPAVRNAVAKLREYIDHRLWREEKILDAWGRGLRTPEEMLPTVYEDVPPQAHPLARRQILAHLERLRRTGRIAECKE